MTTLPIISIVCCTAYILYIVFRFGVPVSLSETFYLLPVKWRWLFSAWCVLSSVPAGIYWFEVAPPSLKWTAVVCVIGLLFVSVSCDYKAPIPKLASGNPKGGRSIWDIIKSLSFKEMFKNGWAKPLHYANSLAAIILSTVYLCKTDAGAVVSTCVMYPVFIAIGMKVDGVYNPDYSADVDNRAWIFFMEVVCFLNLYIYLIF